MIIRSNQQERRSVTSNFKIRQITLLGTISYIIGILLSITAIIRLFFQRDTGGLFIFLPALLCLGAGYTYLKNKIPAASWCILLSVVIGWFFFLSTNFNVETKDDIIGKFILLTLPPTIVIILSLIMKLFELIPRQDSSQKRLIYNTMFEGEHLPSSVKSSETRYKDVSREKIPQEISDRYIESELIGKGGFARVFKAKRKDGQFVAVKIPISLDESTGKSFIAELQNWTRLDHPNIVKVYNFNIMPSPYFEMELCDSSLAEIHKPVEVEEAAWLIFNVCEGLKFTHAQKIIHRDLKPQNILLKNGIPKISDWGLSKVVSESTSTTATSFTPYYAAPEQINSKHKDERTDIWQLGVILYELCTGVLPFRGDGVVEIAVNIATKDPQRPSEIVPDVQPIEFVIMKCLEKDPSKRYQNVLELQKDLAIYLRKNYAELLKTSVTVQDYNQSAYYCGDLVMINLLTGDIPTAYKYLLDLVHYSKGDVKVEAQELSEQIKMRMEMGVTEIPDELIQKTEIIVHQVSVGFRNKG